MTNKQNEQQDKRSQKDSLHNDQKQNKQHDKQRSQKDRWLFVMLFILFLVIV
jgi:hypothetical protein